MIKSLVSPSKNQAASRCRRLLLIWFILIRSRLLWDRFWPINRAVFFAMDWKKMSTLFLVVLTKAFLPLLHVTIHPLLIRKRTRITDFLLLATKFLTRQEMNCA